MRIYTLKRSQFLPLPLREAWGFFSSPQNLKKITPEHMGFQILYQSGGHSMYAGQLIRYTVHVLPLVTVDWVTEITHVDHQRYFVDEQRFGPYSFWHHQHWFREVENGVEMTDEVNYALPLRILGRLANSLFVERKVNAIFDYRASVLNDKFNISVNKSID